MFNTVDVSTLYIPLCLAEGGDLSLKRVGGFMFMDNILIYFVNCNWV
jgi:hypothetical protein